MDEKYISFQRERTHYLIPVSHVVKIIGIHGEELQTEAYKELPLLDFSNGKGTPLMILLTIDGSNMGLLVDYVEGVREIGSGVYKELPPRLKRKDTAYVDRLVVYEDERRIDILLNMGVLNEYAMIRRCENDL